MQTFPTLADQPDVQSWEESRALDPTIRARSEGGYVKTRPRTTRIPMQWKLQYLYLSSSDKATLQSFERSVKVGADAFSWTNPADGLVRTVRMKEPIVYAPVQSAQAWRVEMALEEV
ncbi:MAG: hypothetical protein LLG06_06745 [Desulfobacteraceae bacterium]|nr:hypothetical protein [Desulfobacteraceae bacterium]